MSKDFDTRSLQNTHCRRNIPPAERIIYRKQIDSTYCPNYCTVTYARPNIVIMEFVSVSDSGNIHNDTIKLADLTINNNYKPPGVSWPSNQPPLVS